MSHRRNDNTNNVRNPSSHAFSTGNTFIVQSTDDADMSSWTKWEDEISNILEIEYSSHGQCDALNSDCDNGIFQNSNKRLWGRKEYEQFPVYDGGDFVLKCREKREKHDASWKNQGIQTNFEHSDLNVEGNNKEKMKGISYPRSSELSRMSMNTMPGNVVQNGTSHHNMVDTNVSEGGYFELGKCIDSASSKINVDKKKEKVIVKDNDFHDRHTFEAHSNKSSEGSAYRRHVSSNTSSLPYEEINNPNKQGTSYQKFMSGKRKQHLSNFCESSGVAFENSETLYNQLSRLIPSDGWSGINSKNNSYGCDMELDELQSPNLSFNNHQEQNLRFDDDSARVSQIESDELLARQLQQQYYEEMSGTTSTNEIDANISGSLQEKDSHLVASTTRSDQINNIDANIFCSLHETDSHLAASTTRIDQTNNREESMSDLYAYYTQLASHNSSSRSSNRSQHQISNARRNFCSSEIDLETRMVADLRNFTRMDPGMRHDFLEALEAAFDQSNSALDDFNEDDNYEMLLALNENARASENQIDSLPQSIVQGGKVEETCAICLEVPSFGDKIRHLPCSHKFHLKCIDVWLRRKAFCPVCKSKIP